MSDPISKEKPPFRMVITEVFYIKARGVVVIGTIETGTPKKGRPIVLIGSIHVYGGSIAGIDSRTFPGLANKTGLLLKGVRREDVSVGMVLTTEGAI